MLLAAGLAVRFLPYRVVARTLGTTPRQRRAETEAVTASVSLAVRRASGHVPWRTVCFQEGLATHWMLRRRGVDSRFHYGVRNVGGMSAHVWVSVGGRTVIGESADPHACVAVYPPLAVDG